MNKKDMHITIKNQTDAIWHLNDKDMKHGKCKNKDNKFPSKISAGGEETLYVGKRTGASVGPEGWVQYTTDLKEGGSSELTINFHKPYGSEATTCSANATKNFNANATNKDFQTSDAYCDVIITSR
ncbi:hypothetical protein P4S72_25315 [Vibrio sp. PP-XX7]